MEIVRYKNRRGDAVAAIVDANFDTSDPNVRPDVAVVIAPAILKRKEVFGLLARTILDDLDRDGRKAVVLRFDASYIAGESAMDARLAAEGRALYPQAENFMRVRAAHDAAGKFANAHLADLFYVRVNAEAV